MFVTACSVAARMLAPSRALVNRKWANRKWLIAVAAVLLVTGAGCSSSPGQSTAPTTAPSSSVQSTGVTGSNASPGSGGSSSTTSITPTAAAATPSQGAVNLVVPDAVRPQLLAAYVTFVRHEFGENLVAADVNGPLPGSVYYAKVAATGTYWALAGFAPSSQATFQMSVNFQDNGMSGLFEMKPGQGWVMVAHAMGGGPWPCAGQLDPDLMRVWSMPISPGCVVASSGPLSEPGDTSAWLSPPGFPNGQYFGLIWSVQQDYDGTGFVDFEPETWTSPTVSPTRSYHDALLHFGPAATTEYSTGSSPSSSHVVGGTWNLSFSQRVIGDITTFAGKPSLGFILTVEGDQVTAIQEVGPLTPTGSPDFTAPAP